MATYRNKSYSGRYFTLPSQRGAALKLKNADNIIYNCVFNDNGGRLASTEGGAIAFESWVETVSISDSLFCNNYAEVGGAIAATKSIDLLNVTFSNNHAASYSGEGFGGAIFTATGCDEVNYTVTSGNSISNQGNGATAGGFIYDSTGATTFTFNVQSNAFLTVGSIIAPTDSITLQSGSKLVKAGNGVLTINSDLEFVASGVPTADDITVAAGTLELNRGGAIDGAVTLAGGQLKLGADYVFDSVNFKLSNNNSVVMVSDLEKLYTPQISVDVTNAVAARYVLGGNAEDFQSDIDVVVNTGTEEVIGTLSVGGSFSASNVDYSLSLVGDELILEVAYDVAPSSSASSLIDSGTVVNGDSIAATWDSTTAYAGSVYLTEGMTTGNASLSLDGFEDNSANLYGTGRDQDFAGTVNINAEAGTVKNLAAGAGLGGSVEGVKLTVEDGMDVLGAVFTGGMGSVTEQAETQINGGNFSGSVFAGALCNYAANGQATTEGEIVLTIDGGTFNNNIFAGAAVKAGAATDTVHTVGSIVVDVTAGTALQTGFCLYGGGYATGSVEGAPVYTAGDVDITISGGSWGEYQSGRGIFGGVYSSKVASLVNDAKITVTGGTMGNIYGGGWAQNGGSSKVGDVEIMIAGDAAVANVFGGGSYSSVSGGATEVGNVSITVAGGSIANNIFAGGQDVNSKVAGEVNVTFVGSSNYSCNVYGYTNPTGGMIAPDKVLTFDGFTGALTGSIDGFSSIVFSGNTTATLNGSAVNNDEWEFDYTARTLGGNTAAVALNGGTLAGDTVTLRFAEDADPADWKIATGLTDAAVDFDYEVYVGDMLQVFAGNQIAAGDYAGWGFELNAGVLKFKNLA